MTQQQTHGKQSSFSLTLHQWFIASCLFGFILLCARVIATAKITYVFLLWNLFLAYIPYAISHWLCNNIHIVGNRIKLAAIVVVWILFIPNSFYILTDLFHLGRHQSAPKWFDLLLILSFAWNGLLFGIASLQKMELVLQATSGKKASLLFVFAVMWLIALGIYVGRFLRYNSWDIITQPFSLFGEILEMLMHPFQNKMEWGMILCYATFMSLLYITIKKMSESFNQISK
ncbi:MAG TPA: DUF1361 domain-containing protein [Chitinophagaceae bacterium]|nr:DUF1361 domain-containing protein [Chitinophagaceae bacterium]